MSIEDYSQLRCQACIHQNNGELCGFCEADLRNALLRLGINPNEDLVDQVTASNEKHEVVPC